MSVLSDTIRRRAEFAEASSTVKHGRGWRVVAVALAVAVGGAACHWSEALLAFIRLMS